MPRDGPGQAKRGRVKREYGEDEPKGAKSVTAPATVSGERTPKATGHQPGKVGRAETRESGDLPSCKKPTVPGGVPRKENVMTIPHDRPRPAVSQEQMRHNILVCQACRHTGSPCLPGIELLTKLRAAIQASGLGAAFEVSGTACLAACARRGYQPCTVAWRASDCAPAYSGPAALRSV